MVDGTPKIKPVAANFDENLIQMPLPIRMVPYPFLADFIGNIPAKTIYSKPNGLVANTDTPLVKDVFDLSKNQRKTHVMHHRQADDFGARFEIFEDVGVGHHRKLCSTPAVVKFL